MPLYDYECLSCGHVFELRQSFHAAPEAQCPLCSGDSRRKFHAVPVIYKGSGFYTTDYKKSSYNGASKEEKTKDEDGAKEKTKNEDGAKEKTKKAKATAGGSEDKKEAAKEA